MAMLKFTIEELNSKLKYINPSIEITDDVYVNARTKLRCKCLVDGHEWSVTWDNLKRGRGCPGCKLIRLKKSHSDFVKEVKETQPKIKIISKYNNMRSVIDCVCLIDGHKFKTRADSLLKNSGCPKCSSLVRSKSHEKFVQEMNYINSDIEFVTKYINKRTHVMCRCLKDGHEWLALPSNLLIGYGCYKCNPSKGEGLVSNHLDDIGIEYLQQFKFEDCKNELPLRFDFYIPSKNICIEYDGEQHFKPIKYFGGQEKFKKVLENDSIKNDYCRKKKIKLIRIPYTENNIPRFMNEQLSILL